MTVVTVVTVVASWLMTYLVHSTLLLGGVALATRWVRREAVRETLWKTALVGGLVTATAAMALPRPGAARVELSALGASDRIASVEGAVPSDAAARRPERGIPSDAVVAPGVDTEVDSNEDSDANTASPASSTSKSTSTSTSIPGTDSDSDSVTGGRGGLGWVAWGVAVWAVLASMLLVRLAYRHVRLRWLLRDRRQVPGDDRAAVALAELRRTAGVWRPVRLTATPAVATPLALGTVEVCVPERFLAELGAEEQRAALAHELAHLARRDPFWQLAASVIGAVLFVQPLNRVARREIRSAAEYLADGWAVARTGSRVELARCLASVAGWVAPSGEPILAGTVAMAEGGSPLLSRVQRLLEQEPESPARPALRLALAAGVVVVGAAFAPAVGPATPAGPADPADPAAPGATADAAADPAADPDGSFADRLREGVGEGMREGIPEGVAEALDELGVTGPQEPLVVRRFDRPGREGDGFVARLNDAGRAAKGSPYWVAYAIPTVGGAEPNRVTDTAPWSMNDLTGEPLEHRLGVAEELDRAGAHVLVLVRLVPEGAATRVDRIAVRDPRFGMRIGGTVYWLGRPDAAESFRWFRDIHTASWGEEIREGAVEAIAYHDVPEVEPYLMRVLENDPTSDVRESAVEGLAALRPDPELAMLFFDVALNDPQGGVRHEATERLADMEPALAVELLERLAVESKDPGVQRQAAESLGEVGTEAARAALRRLVKTHPSERVQREALDQLSEVEPSIDGTALLEIARTADAPGLRREAVELMERLPPDEAVAVLARAVFESGDATVERQAAESLGRIGTEAALRVLVEVLDRNPSQDASLQAVESVAENYPREEAMAVLRAVVTSHPSDPVRREALEQLADLGG